MSYSPFMASITLTQNTITKLSTKVAAIDPSPFLVRVSYCQIELDVTAGGDNLYIGPSTVSAANCGRHLVGAQNQNTAVYDMGVLLTSDIFLFCDGIARQVNLILIPAGM